MAKFEERAAGGPELVGGWSGQGLPGGFEEKRPRRNDGETRKGRGGYQHTKSGGQSLCLARWCLLFESPRGEV